MMKRILLIVILVFLGLSCSQSSRSLDTYFPESWHEDWQSESKPVYYNPDNLYDYINGEAELYHAYHFKQLATRTYLKNGNEDSFLVVDVYDMGTPLNAFGVYSNYRYPHYTFEKIGTEAVVSDYGLRFLKSSIMVEIKADDASEVMKKATLRLAENVAKRIEGEAAFPNEIKLLSPNSQDKHTVRYVADGMLNQDFLPGGLEATYHINGEELTGFIVLLDDSDNSPTQLKATRDAYQEMGSNTFEISEGERFSIGVQTRYEGLILIGALDQYLVGVRGGESMEKSYILLEQLRKYLKSLKN